VGSFVSKSAPRSVLRNRVDGEIQKSVRSPSEALILRQVLRIIDRPYFARASSSSKAERAIALASKDACYVKSFVDLVFSE
jgi:hypothetical protein